MIFKIDKILSAFKRRKEILSYNFKTTIVRNPSYIDTICKDQDSSVLLESSSKKNVIFGPVPSRRLGYSLGINNIRFKVCSYNCTYCQVGRTTHCTLNRESHLNPHWMYALVKEKVSLLAKQHVNIDYISIVSNGEPTLDIDLSKQIMFLRRLGYKIAVFTNSSLLWNDNVKESLSSADYVSVKIDSVNEKIWKRIDRPHGKLKLDTILKGISDFTKFYQGTLTTETMLVKNMNDNIHELEAISSFINNLKRNKSYFAVPVRPPAEQYAIIPDTRTLSELSSFIKSKVANSEMLCLSEDDDFKGTESIKEELLGILSVHPMTKEKIEKFIISKAGSPDILQYMIDKKMIKQFIYNDKVFYKNTHLE